MKLPIFQVDAFASQQFAANPAAVVVLQEWLPDATLQSIAAENNLSETAFVIPRDGEMPLRWFSPTVEVELCGHATLATAHVLFRHGFAASPKLVFRYGGGNLTVTRDGDLLRMDCPALPAEPLREDPRVSEGLGKKPQHLMQSTNLLAVIDEQEQIEALNPDFSILGSLDTFGVIVTAPGRDCDIVSGRFFTPGAGVPEDPVTGSAHCALVPYWSQRLAKRKLHARQVSAQTRGGGRTLLRGSGRSCAHRGSGSRLHGWRDRSGLGRRP